MIKTKKDLKQVYTLKLYPYLQPQIERFVNKINNIAFDTIGYEELRESLYPQVRKDKGDFNRSLALEFLLNLFSELDNDEDMVEFVIPLLRRFVLEKAKTRIIQ